MERKIIVFSLLLLMVGFAFGQGKSRSENHTKALRALQGQEHANALTFLNAAIAEEGESAELLTLRGKANYLSGNKPAALADLDKVIADHPDHAPAFAQRAEVRGNNGDLGGAIADLSEAVRLDPADGRSYHVRGLFYKVRGKDNLACQDWQQALDLGFAPSAKIIKTNCQ